MPMYFVGYHKGQKLDRFAFEQVSDILQQPETFIWVTLAHPLPDELGQLQEEFNLHELAIEDANSAHQRPKLEEYGETLFLVLHTARLEGDATVYGELHAFIGKQFVILIQHGEVNHYDRVRQRCESSQALFAKGSGFVVYALLDFIVDQFMLVGSFHQRQLDTLEADIFDSRVEGPLIERIYELKREVAKLHIAATPVGDICSALLRFHPDLFPRELKHYYRDVQDHVLRVTRTMQMIREALSDAMQVNLALVTVRQNEVVKRLAGWGAILAIPTMIFSLYGMNFDTMPELHSPYGYPAAMAVTLIGCILLYRRLKKSGWL